MSNNIEPTVGRVVLYRPNDGSDSDVRHAATVACVTGAAGSPEGVTYQVSLGIIDSRGAPYKRQDVSLVCFDKTPEAGEAEWMEYQKNQVSAGSCGGIDISQMGDGDKEPDQGIPSIEAIAEKCHEANREYCQSIGDKSQLAWEDAPKLLKASVLNGVEIVLSNLDISASESHDNWLAYKSIEGWKYGKKKNVKKRLHPNMVAYSDLPEDQQRKDEIFLQTVRDCVAGK